MKSAITLALCLAAMVASAVLSYGCGTAPVAIHRPVAWFDGEVYTLSQRVDWCRSRSRIPNAECNPSLALPETVSPESK